MPHASCFLIVTSQCDICPHKHDLDAIQMMSNFCIFLMDRRDGSQKLSDLILYDVICTTCWA